MFPKGRRDVGTQVRVDSKKVSDNLVRFLPPPIPGFLCFHDNFFIINCPSVI